MDTDIRKLIVISDIHIRNYKRHDEYIEKIKWFVDKCQELVNEYGTYQTRIVIAGDIFHNKTDISPEAYMLAYNFLNKLQDIAHTIIIAGNHDMSKNTGHADPLSALSEIGDLSNVTYADSELNYESGCIKDNNIVWCVYSSFDSFKKPNIECEKIEHPDCKYIGLFHGLLNGSTTDTGYKVENGLNSSYFDGLDMCIMGHIHKRQKLDYEGIPLVYVGSLIQQDMGENLSNHGFIVIDVGKLTYEEYDTPTGEYGFYNFSINSENDIDEDLEEIINL